MSATTRETPRPVRPSSGTPTARSLIRQPFAWSLVALGALLAATMTFSYLHGFLEPTRRLENLPVGIVDLDRGATFGTTTVDGGRQVLGRTAAAPGHATAPRPTPDGDDPPADGDGQVQAILDSSNRKRVNATTPNSTAMPRSTPMGNWTPPSPCPSRMTDRNPRIAQYVGVMGAMV